MPHCSEAHDRHVEKRTSPDDKSGNDAKRARNVLLVDSLTREYIEETAKASDTSLGCARATLEMASIVANTFARGSVPTKSDFPDAPNEYVPAWVLMHAIDLGRDADHQQPYSPWSDAVEARVDEPFVPRFQVWCGDEGTLVVYEVGERLLRASDEVEKQSPSYLIEYGAHVSHDTRIFQPKEDCYDYMKEVFEGDTDPFPRTEDLADVMRGIAEYVNRAYAKVREVALGN